MGREFFLPLALDVAPRLLGARLAVDSVDGPVRIRITEVEAYHGIGTPEPFDAGSHARTRRTERNASMFGPPGHAYVYFSYGMHFALNLVCSPERVASGVLLRSAEIIEGADLARQRRLEKRGGNRAIEFSEIPSSQLARGPGNLAAALGLTREQHDGADLFSSPFSFEQANDAVVTIASGPRVGVAGEAGSALFPWRFWIAGEPTVSAYRPGRGVPNIGVK